jgi:hypothetical protein
VPLWQASPVSESAGEGVALRVSESHLAKQQEDDAVMGRLIESGSNQERDSQSRTAVLKNQEGVAPAATLG